MALPGIKRKLQDMQNNHGSIPRHEHFTGTSQKPKDKKSQHPGGEGPAATQHGAHDGARLARFGDLHAR